MLSSVPVRRWYARSELLKEIVMTDRDRIEKINEARLLIANKLSDFYRRAHAALGHGFNEWLDNCDACEPDRGCKLAEKP